MYNDIHNGETPGHPHGEHAMDDIIGKCGAKNPLHFNLPAYISGEESGGGEWSQSGGKPSEEERASWEEQRQRREKLSSLMGQYLLKGYRMLSSNCSDCGVCTTQVYKQ